MTKKRNALQIASEVLHLCKTPKSQTYLMGHADLNYVVTKMIVSYLLDQGFIQHVEGYYVLTEYGSEFLEGLDLVLQMWTAPVLESSIRSRS